MDYAKDHAEFVTVTCLEWNHLLEEDRFKDIIIESLRYLSSAKRVYIYEFVIMSNHFHLIWQMVGENKKADVQRDFLKYTAQQILKHLRNEKPEVLERLIVNAQGSKVSGMGT
jgi:REP element-mobilizing transposase RayT